MAKFVKVGCVWKNKEEGKDAYIALGQGKAKDKKYERHIDIRVRDGNGNVLATVTNGFLSVLDPRKNPNLKPEELERIPENLLKEIFIIQKD